MLNKNNRFWVLALGLLSVLNFNSVYAFDTVTGGGEAFIGKQNFDNASKKLVTDLLLTTNAAVTSELVTITIPGGALSALEFSTDPVALITTSGSFVVENLNQTIGQIDFEITGTGTLSVSNIGLYATDAAVSDLSEDHILNINFQGTNVSTDFFHIDTRDFALGFGGGEQINASHSASGSAQTLENLILVSANPLVSEVITIRPDSGAAYSVPATASLNISKSVISGSVLVASDNFADGDIITVNDGGSDTTFTLSAVTTVGDLQIFLNSITNLTASFNDALDTMDLTATADFTISSDGVMPTLLIGPGTSTTGSLSLINTTLDGADILQNLDQFTDTDIITATDSDSNETNFTITAFNTVSDLNNFFEGLNNITSLFDDPSNQYDLISNEDYVISSSGAMPVITLAFGEPANLQFASLTPNFVVNNGSLTIDNVSFTADQLQFELSGSGELEIQNLALFADNMAEKGEFFELRFLEINALATDFSAERLVVDTTDYGTKMASSGATGGDGGEIFIVGDTMNFTFAPFDYSGRLSTTRLNLATIGGNDRTDVSESFTIVADNDDGSFSVPLTVTYTGTNVEANYTSFNVDLDNQLPSYDFSDHDLLVLPEGKTVAGINDIITLTLPTENSGDTVLMTVDFSAVGGSITDLVEVPAVDTSIALEEVGLDTAAFTVDVLFRDDAGNTLPIQATNLISIDLIRPVLVTADVLSITGNPVPGKIGDTFEVALPIDTVGTLGDVITYNLDMSLVGGATSNFVATNVAQNFAITAGTLNDVPFNQTLTVFDKAQNSVSATTNTLQIDNAVPTFNTSCGATFQVINQGEGDENFIADFNNGAADGVFFLFPDKNEVGCDFDSFSIDLRAITGSPAGTVFTNQDADGTGRIMYVNQGNIDNSILQFPIKIFDVNGNESDFLTGSINLDQRLATKEQLKDRTEVLTGSGPNTSILAGGKLNVLLDVTEVDIMSVSAEIEGAARTTLLNRTSDGRWNAELNIDPGFLDFEPKFITYTLVDDAGNVVKLEGDKSFYITNDTREIKGGGGGSLNFSNISKKETLQRFTPNQSKTFHDKNQAIKTKSKAQLRLESLRRRMTYPMRTQSRIISKPEGLVDEQRAAWRSRQAALAADGTPKRMQSRLEKLALAKESAADIAAARVDAGEFKLRSTLANLKGITTAAKNHFSSRTVAPFHRGKYLEVQR